MLASTVSKLVEGPHGGHGRAKFLDLERGRKGWRDLQDTSQAVWNDPGMCFLKWAPPPDFCHLQLYYILVTMSLPSSLLAISCTKLSYSHYSISRYCSHSPKGRFIITVSYIGSYYVTQASFELPVMFLHHVEIETEMEREHGLNSVTNEESTLQARINGTMFSEFKDHANTQVFWLLNYN